MSQTAVKRSDAHQESMDSMSSPLISREPWWAIPPRAGQSEQDLQWGYLEIYADGTFRFDPTRPSDEEIRNRRGCWMSRDSD